MPWTLDKGRAGSSAAEIEYRRIVIFVLLSRITYNLVSMLLVQGWTASLLPTRMPRIRYLFIFTEIEAFNILCV